MTNTTEVRVRYAETDQMGIVYHTHYLVWCEIGRTELIRALGITYAEVEQRGYFLAVAQADVRFHAPARYDDVIGVVTRIERVQSRAITFAYDISRAAPGPVMRLASAHTTLVSLSADGAPTSMPPDLLERFRNAISSS